jgi:hypothetical protein
LRGGSHLRETPDPDLATEGREIAMKRLVPTLGLLSILLIGLMAPSAVAGGNWLEFRTAERDPRPSPSRWDIFPAGESLVARVGYLSGAFELGDGPFHLWIERGDALEAGMPIPQSAIRVGTFEMAPDGTGGHAAFDLPALPSGTYSFAVCDDPCTERGFGFGEFVQGWLTVVQTPEEARLLVRVRALRENARTKKRESRADLRVAELREGRLTTRLDTAVEALDEARAQVERLTRSASRPHDQAMIGGAGGAWIAVGLVAAALIMRRRRAPRIDVPDTPAELLSPSERVLEDLDV